AGAVVIHGGEDSDVITINGNITATGYIEIHGHGGADRIVVNGHLNAPEIRFYADDGDDYIVLNANNAAGYQLSGHVQVFAGAGADRVIVNRLNSRTASLDIDGGGGTDDVT